MSEDFYHKINKKIEDIVLFYDWKEYNKLQEFTILHQLQNLIERAKEQRVKIYINDIINFMESGNYKSKLNIKSAKEILKELRLLQATNLNINQ